MIRSFLCFIGYHEWYFSFEEHEDEWRWIECVNDTKPPENAKCNYCGEIYGNKNKTS